jgi:raffinose/stachyose/melibiose transport system substrate-binding protein
LKKIGLLFVVTIMLMSLLAGCGSSTNVNETSNEGNINKSTEEVKPKAKDVKLNIMLTGQGRFKDQFDEYLTQFTKKELAEKNINVTYELELPAEKTLLKTRLASGDAPDIYSLHAAFDSADFEKGGYLPDLTNEPFAGKLLDDVREIVTINDKVFAVPMESFTWNYLYNKTIFEKYGLTPPTTLTEMKQVVETLNSNKVTPFLLPYKDHYFAGWLTQLAFCSIAANQIPDWWERMNKGEASFNELKDKGMFDIIDLVNANGSPRPLDVGADDGVAKFAKGEAAMLITGPWYSESILSVDPDFKLGLAGLPVNDDPTNTNVMLAVSSAITVNPEGKNKEVALDFINYILDDQDSSAFFEKLKFNKLATNQTIETLPWTTEGLTYVEKGFTYQDKAIPNAANDTMGKMSQLYYLGQLTQQQFVDEIDKEWKKSLEVQ